MYSAESNEIYSIIVEYLGWQHRRFDRIYNTIIWEYCEIILMDLCALSTTRSDEVQIFFFFFSI